MGSWPDFPKLQKPEGITDVEWEIYQTCDLRKIDPRIRDKVEKALGWKDDDVAAAREIAEQVLGAVRIEDRRPKETTIAERRQNRRDAGLPLGGGLDASPGKGHVPEENIDRYLRIKRIADQLGRLGNHVSGYGEHGDANKLWALESKYKRMANELRVDLPKEEQ